MKDVTLITITGPSGSGKDMFARMLSEETGIKILCSYTTRPRRPGEEDGREHLFVPRREIPIKNTLAHTYYGGYEYWTTLDQINGSAIYVIDELGLLDMMRRFPKLKIITIYISASLPIRIFRGVKIKRIKRDLDRLKLPILMYDYFISNNSTKKSIRKKACKLSRYILSSLLHFTQKTDL